MQIHLLPDHERFIRDKVSSGAFASESDVISSAIEALKAQEPSPTYVAYVRRALAEADADIEAGRVGTLDLETAKREVRQRFRGGADGQSHSH